MNRIIQRIAEFNLKERMISRGVTEENLKYLQNLIPQELKDILSVGIYKSGIYAGSFKIRLRGGLSRAENFEDAENMVKATIKSFLN